MKLYRGPLLLALGLLFLVIATIIALTAVSHGTLMNLIVVLSLAMSIVCSLAFIAMSERFWIPKWERDEKRTGRQPGDE